METIDAAARPKMHNHDFIHQISAERELSAIEPVMSFGKVNHSFLKSLSFTLKLRPLTKSSSLAR